MGMLATTSAAASASAVTPVFSLPSTTAVGRQKSTACSGIEPSPSDVTTTWKPAALAASRHGAVESWMRTSSHLSLPPAVRALSLYFSRPFV
jgi:hypothetical protein